MCAHNIGVARGGLGAIPQIFSISSDFVLREVVFQTKYCCVPKVKDFGPQKILGGLRHLPITRNDIFVGVLCQRYTCS